MRTERQGFADEAAALDETFAANARLERELALNTQRKTASGFSNGLPTFNGRQGILGVDQTPDG